jgi:phage shock protein A
MPIPLLVPVLLGGASVAAAAFGLKKGHDGIQGIRDAERRGAQAKAQHAEAAAAVEAARQRLQERAQAFGLRKERAVTGLLSDMLRFLELIQQRARARSVEVLEEVHISREELGAFRAQVLDARFAFGAAPAALAAGAAAGQGALGAIGLFGAASTGTAISGLSGVAATNATLAWLGGGSLAAGGGGMALGSAVLGGVVVGPAVFVTGYALATQGEKAQTQVRAYEAQVAEAIAQCGTLVELLGQVHTRMDELETLIDALEARLRPALAALDPQTWDPDDDDHVRAFQSMMLLARALGEVVRAPVLDPSGGLSAESARVQFTHRALVR